MTILLGVIVLFAILSLVLTIVQGRAVARLAPAGADMGGTFWLRWWRFDEIEAKAGPAAARHVAIYKRAAIAFVVFIVLGLVSSGLAANS